MKTLKQRAYLMKNTFKAMTTPYRIALVPARKSHQTELLFTHENSDLGAATVTVSKDQREKLSGQLSGPLFDAV